MILGLGVLGSCGLLSWIIFDRSLDWSRTLVFAPWLALTLVGLATLGFLIFVVFALSAVLRG